MFRSIAIVRSESIDLAVLNRDDVSNVDARVVRLDLGDRFSARAASGQQN